MSKPQRPIEEIAPDDFLDTWGATSYEGALKRAEQSRTSTPDSELPKCPTCDTRRVYAKPSDASTVAARDHDTEYVCHNRHHFDNPVYGDESDEDAFVWVDHEDLAEPPLTRQLAALDDGTLTALAIYCYRPWGHTDADPSYQELGDFFGYSRQWVGERVRAWKDGDHRDLVADPRPRIEVSAE